MRVKQLTAKLILCIHHVSVSLIIKLQVKKDSAQLCFDVKSNEYIAVWVTRILSTQLGKGGVK